MKQVKPEPRYHVTRSQGLLTTKIKTARAMLEACTLCPRACRVDRLNGQTGICRTGSRARVSSWSPHFGEEPPITGISGSGTVFFTHCNLMCAFCQNAEISHQGRGRDVTAEELAAIFLKLQDLGCHNINLVTPSHVIPQILEALDVAAGLGLSLPLVYNSGGYDALETLKLLDGVVDIYMPDFKFWDAEPAALTCDAPDYATVAQAAVLEMHRQVGTLVMDDQGIAISGLLVRHLVLPEGMAGTDRVMEFLQTRVSPETFVNVMSQYRPCANARLYEGFDRPVTAREFRAAVAEARSRGLNLVR